MLRGKRMWFENFNKPRPRIVKNSVKQENMSSKNMANCIHMILGQGGKTR